MPYLGESRGFYDFGFAATRLNYDEASLFRDLVPTRFGYDESGIYVPMLTTEFSVSKLPATQARGSSLA